MIRVERKPDGIECETSGSPLDNITEATLVIVQTVQRVTHGDKVKAKRFLQNAISGIYEGACKVLEVDP